MTTITVPPLASERALYADLVTPAPGFSNREIFAFDPLLDGPISYRLTALAESLCALQDALDARRADGPISLLPEPR